MSKSKFSTDKRNRSEARETVKVKKRWNNYLKRSRPNTWKAECPVMLFGKSKYMHIYVTFMDR